MVVGKERLAAEGRAIQAVVVNNKVGVFQLLFTERAATVKSAARLPGFVGG